MTDDAQAGYAVGYRRPPKHTRFKKGKSGNPSGKQRQPPESPFDLDRRMREPITAISNGEPLHGCRREIEIRSVVKKAVHGDLKSIQYFLDLVRRYDETASQNIRSRGSVLHTPARLPPTMAQLLFEKYGAAPWSASQRQSVHAAYDLAATQLERRLVAEGIYQL